MIASKRAAAWTLVIAAALAVGCTAGETTPLEAPPRPESVPEGAIWVGGLDGGVFIDVEKLAQDPPAIYRGTVYDEYSGEVWFSGLLELDPPGGAVDLSMPGLFTGWDGEALYLEDGRALIAIQEQQ